jgi:hypothetical protein
VLDTLPPEILAKIASYLPAIDRAHFEQVSSPCKEITRRLAWDASAYSGVAHDTVHLDPYKTRSDAFKALCRERREMERAMAPFLQPGVLTVRHGWTPREQLARVYNQRGLHKQATVALGDPPAYPHSRLNWLEEMKRASLLAKNDANAKRAQDAIQSRRDVERAIERNDLATVCQTLTRSKRRIELPEFKLALNLAVTGASVLFPQICQIVAANRTQATFRDAGYDPIAAALRTGNAGVLDTLVTHGFPCNGQQLAVMFSNYPLTLGRALEGARHSAEELQYAMAAACRPSDVPLRHETLRLLMNAGADVSAPLPTRGLCLYPNSWEYLRLPPFLAVLMLSRGDVLPFVTQLFAGGADPHVVQPETGGNAWHFLVAGAPRDFEAVARWLHAQRVAINLRTRKGTTPLGLCLSYGWERVPLLIELGADIRGPQDRKQGTDVDGVSLAFAMSALSVRNVETLIRAGAPLPKGVLQRAWNKGAHILQVTLERGDVPVRSLNAAVARALPRLHRLVNWERKLRLLVQYGANINVVAKPTFGGDGARGVRRDVSRVCPGLLPTAALAVTGKRGQALPAVRLFHELGADLNAAGPAGSTIWHALALVQPTDAIALAVFLRQARVRIDRVATTADGNRVTPLAWIEANSGNVALKAVMRSAASDPVAPADAPEGRPAKRRRL